MENWNFFLNKEIKIIYDDFGQYPKKKMGVLVQVNDSHLVLKIDGHYEALLLSRILRVETNNGVEK